ncbi:integrin alpha-6-like [Oncorhynchus kisutch]|uniref:integrin alpha-6-like n=1 Tax=Oncorhynchus kisutch TaxID=8019 RepID=UPI0012DFB7FD|nr:integrin alpha-6-like [Oncorhynchus kisutch]
MHSLPIAVNYAFEADAETRKQRRSSRMQFLFQSQGVLELAGQGKDERSIPVISAGDEDIALEVNVTNREGDDAHQSHLIIKLPDSLSFSSLYLNHISEVLVKCNPNDNGTLTDCELGNPFKRDAEVTFYVILSTSRISLSTTDVNITLQLETTSVQKIQASEAKAKVVFELHLQVFGLARPSQVSFGGAVKGESAMKSEDDIGTLVEYEFRYIQGTGMLYLHSTAAILQPQTE